MIACWRPIFFVASAIVLGLAGCSNEPDAQLSFDAQADNEGRPPAVSDAERALAGTGSLTNMPGEQGKVAEGLAETLDPVGDAVQTGVEGAGDAAAGVVGETEVESGAPRDRDHMQREDLENAQAMMEQPAQR